MDDAIFAEIADYCSKFENAAYHSLADKYVHFLWKESQRFRSMIEGRDSRIVELLKQNGELRQDISKLRQELLDRKKA